MKFKKEDLNSGLALQPNLRWKLEEYFQHDQTQVLTSETKASISLCTLGAISTPLCIGFLACGNYEGALATSLTSMFLAKKIFAQIS